MTNQNTGAGNQFNIGNVQGDLNQGNTYNYNQAQIRRACPTPPPPPEHFAGRDDELNALAQKLREGKVTAIAAVQGMGGIGKTTLALQLANALYHDNSFQAVLWLTISEQPDPHTLLVGWGYKADPKFNTNNQPLEHLAGRIKDLLDDLLRECGVQRCLVVFDDVWQASQETVKLLRRASPTNSIVLMTGRDKRVLSRLGAEVIELDRLQEDKAVALLLEYLPGGDKELLAKLAEALGGYTIALKLAAYRISDNTGRQERQKRLLIQHIEDYLATLPSVKDFAELGLDLEGYDEQLSKVIERSYQALTKLEQTRFRALGVIAYNQPFDLIMLASLWQVEVDEAEKTAERFCQLALLENGNVEIKPLVPEYYQIKPEEEKEELLEGWYSQHEVIRAFARAVLHKLGKEKQYRELHHDYLAELVKKYRELPQEEWWQLALYFPHFQIAGNEIITAGEAGLEIDKLTLYGGFLHWVGWVSDTLGQKNKALEYYRQALPFRKKAKDKIGEITTLNNIGTVYSDLGEKRKALKYYKKVLPVTRNLGDKRKEAATLNNIGSIYSDLGQQRKALEYYKQTLLIIRSIEDKEGEAITLNNIGGIYSATGETILALKYFEDSLPLIRVSGNKREEARILNNIGGIYDDLQENDKALDYYEQILPFRRLVGDIKGEAATLNNIGSVYSNLGENNKALEYFEQALILTRTVEDRRGEATTLNNIGLIYNNLGETDKALEYYNQALPIHRAVGNKNMEATTLHNIGLVYDSLGKKDMALEYYDQALLLLRAVGNRSGEAITCYNIGMIHCDLGQIVEAVKNIKRCVELREQIKHPNLENDRQVLLNLQSLLANGADVNSVR
jgi:tetratricopeptide (TPR) repeat protein